MREYKFRGKALNNTLIAGSKLYFDNEWVYGNLIIADDGTTIIQTWDRTKGVGYTHKTFAIVDPETVGEYTGLKDKNGKEVYESDRCTDGKITFVIEWNKFTAGFVVKGKNNENGRHIDIPLLYLHMDLYEVIGNIYEGVNQHV